MKLYFSPTSPYVRKVLICAHELGVVDRIDIVPTHVSPIAAPGDHARRNPLMKLPTLELTDGECLYDSLVICEYLDAVEGGRLIPSPGPERRAAMRLHALGNGIMDAAALARYEAVLRPAHLRWDDWSKGQWAKVEHGLDALEAEASEWRDAFLIGQIGVVCALGTLDFRFPERNWRATRPSLDAWASAVAARPSVRSTLPAQ